MDIQFEIHSHLEKKHYVEYYRYIWRKRMIWVIIYAVIGSLGLLLGLADGKSRWVIYGVALILYGVWLYFRPWMAAAKYVKQNTRFDGTETVESVTRFGDEIQDATASVEARVSYDKIKSIHVSKNVLVLQDIRKMDFILDKNGFTQGNLEEFLLFIQEKCPQLNLPKW